MSEFKRIRWPYWSLAAVLLLPVLYVGSFGPACWLAQNVESSREVVAAIYFPLGRMAADRKSWIRNPLSWSVILFASPVAGFAGFRIFEVPVGPNDEWGKIGREDRR